MFESAAWYVLHRTDAGPPVRGAVLGPFATVGKSGASCSTVGVPLPSAGGLGALRIMGGGRFFSFGGAAAMGGSRFVMSGLVVGAGLAVTPSFAPRAAKMAIM